MKVIKCACGGRPMFDDWRRQGFSLWQVTCENYDCWRGPFKRTREEAAESWNDVMNEVDINPPDNESSWVEL